MLNRLGIQRPSRARLLLFGLLALLLWGQCALVRLVVPDLPIPRYSVQVVQVDSLTAASATKPPILHVTLKIHNKKRDELTAVGIYDELFWQGRCRTETHQIQRVKLLVPGHADQQVALALSLDAQPELSCDSVQLLRKALRQGGSRRLLLKLKVNDFVYGKSASVTLPLPPMKR